MKEPEIAVSFAWWLKPYMAALVFFCVLMHRQPDTDKLHATFRRATRIRIR